VDVVEEIERLLVKYQQKLDKVNSVDFLLMYEEFIRQLSLINEDVFELFFETDYTYYKSTFTNYQQRYLSIKELETSESILKIINSKCCSIRDLLEFEFGKNSYDRVCDLSAMVDFSCCNQIVMVGCGGFPATLLWLYDHYPEKDYIGIDINKTCTELASQIIDVFGIKGIQIEQENGGEYDYSGVDFVYVANQVMPKVNTLNRVLNTSDKNIQIVVRNPTFRGKLLAECVKGILPDEFSIIQEGVESQSFLSMDLSVRLNKT
jgi:hypothetical protein